MRARKATERVALSQKFVQKLPVQTTPARLHYYDESVRDLGLRVDSNGRKSFFWFKKIDGKPTFRAIGVFPSTSVEEARGHAHRLSADLDALKRANFEGTNPFEKKERSKAPTFGELIDLYVEQHVKREANRPEKAEAHLRWMVKKYFSEWTHKSVNDIRVEHVLALRNAVAKKPYLANRLVEVVRAVFNFCAGKKDGKVNVWVVENPARDVEMFDEKKRERFLQPDELLKFNQELKKLKKKKDADLRDFLTLALGTAARKENILSMQWADVSFERLNWHIPLSKNGKGYDVGLTPAVLEVLERRRTKVPRSVPFVFPSHSASGHVIDLKKRWEVFRKRAGIPDVRIHDLRRTAGSYAAISGVSLQQIGSMLGHKSLQSTEIYARLNQQAVAQARATGEAKMLELMNDAKKRTRRLVAPRRRLLKEASNG